MPGQGYKWCQQSRDAAVDAIRELMDRVSPAPEDGGEYVPSVYIVELNAAVASFAYRKIEFRHRHGLAEQNSIPNPDQEARIQAHVKRVDAELRRSVA
jgi:hypothetical protein